MLCHVTITNVRKDALSLDYLNKYKLSQSFVKGRLNPISLPLAKKDGISIALQISDTLMLFLAVDITRDNLKVILHFRVFFYFLVRFRTGGGNIRPAKVVFLALI